MSEYKARGGAVGLGMLPFEFRHGELGRLVKLYQESNDFDKSSENMLQMKELIRTKKEK